MRIGVLCSGGDAPGMNPCIRAIVRAAGAYGDEVVGIRHGYQGLINGEFWTSPKDLLPELTIRAVSGLTSKGGTILNSSRSKEFETEAGRLKAVENLKKAGIDSLLTLGGNGTLTGANELKNYWDGQIIGIPCTIDNDLLGTDFTIGFATAVNTAVEAIDKLRDTAGSHDMMFLVEIMGRECGDLALHTALAGGCEMVAVPEIQSTVDDIVKRLQYFKDLGKKSMIMVVAEGDEHGGAIKLLDLLKQGGSPYEMRVVVLGHVQRGGSPVPADRILATKLGCFAVEQLHKGETGKMTGELGDQLVLTPFQEVIVDHRQIKPEMLDLLHVIAS